MKFIAEYVIRIEGEETQPTIASTSAFGERRVLESLHATEFFADEVERIRQTNLTARKVSVIPLDKSGKLAD